MSPSDSVVGWRWCSRRATSSGTIPTRCRSCPTHRIGRALREDADRRRRPNAGLVVVGVVRRDLIASTDTCAHRCVAPPAPIAPRWAALTGRPSFLPSQLQNATASYQVTFIYRMVGQVEHAANFSRSASFRLSTASQPPSSTRATWAVYPPSCHERVELRVGDRILRDLKPPPATIGAAASRRHTPPDQSSWCCPSGTRPPAPRTRRCPARRRIARTTPGRGSPMKFSASPAALRCATGTWRDVAILTSVSCTWRIVPSTRSLAPALGDTAGRQGRVDRQQRARSAASCRAASRPGG